jgi:hypothetical protein
MLVNIPPSALLSSSGAVRSSVFRHGLSSSSSLLFKLSLSTAYSALPAPSRDCQRSLSYRGGASSTSTSSTALQSNINSNQTATTTPKSIAATLYDQFFLLHSGLRYFLSGTIGNLLMFHLDSIISRLLSSSALFASYSEVYPFLNSSLKSITFFLAYLAQIPAQHMLNALLVYSPSSIMPLKTQ